MPQREGEAAFQISLVSGPEPVIFDFLYTYQRATIDRL